MTKNDKNLIDEFSKLHYTQWMDVDKYYNAADTQECRDRLIVMSHAMYQQEEYNAHVL